MSFVNALNSTFDHAQDVISAVKPEQLDSPTPCSEWNVRQLLEHTIGAVQGLTAMAGGPPPVAEFALGGDPAGQFKEIAANSVAHWSTPGALDGEVPGPGGHAMPKAIVAQINILDTATHAWDIATATGQSAELPAALLEAANNAAQAVVSPALREGRFGPEVTAPEGASPTEQLMAFLGRTV